MTLSDISTLITLKANADTNAFPNATRLILINQWYQKIASMILDSQDDWDWDDTNRNTEAIITKSMVANQNYVSLAVSDAIIKVKRVEVTYDGTTWHEAGRFDIGQTGQPTDTTSVNQDFNTAQPYYDQRGLYVYLYPIPTSNVTNGVKIWVSREPTEFTSGDLTTGTAKPGFDTAFHPMMALGPAFEWATAKGLVGATALGAELADYEVRLRRQYSTKNIDNGVALTAAYKHYE
jgi:hypothetical protein